MITEIFDGEETVLLYKPIDQTKVFTRDLDMTGKELMAKISTYSPLYLATQDAFPDIDDQHRELYCARIFKKVVKLLEAKHPQGSKHSSRLQQALVNYRENEVYRHIFDVLVRH